ncbi:MFS transporter [Clostridium merdae]|uniref:MFS transporter n=1 Tax=Clostridium merdae TaxID=1958780 RepID=UPI000A26A6C3|nr:MFS transporter [Clostridium merdae]
MNKTRNNSFLKFGMLCSGAFIAAIGNGISSFGLGVYVFQQTGLASSSTLITLLAFLPGLLLTPFAGVLADRYDRRLLMILGDGLSAFGLIYILICMMMGEAQVWQIGIGVTISSIFSSLMEPSFKATVTDLLTEEEYSKASGLVQLSGAAKYLISPLIAGFLLTVSDVKLLLVIDICTIFITVTVTTIVRKGLISKDMVAGESFRTEIKTGMKALTNNKGVFALVLSGIGISFFLGCVQSLYTPLILGFADSSVLGFSTTVSASGMLVSSLILGMIAVKKNFTKVLSISLFLAGIFMAGFGLRENIVLICIFGFLFFSMLPFANMSLDYLIRTNISNDVQGRVWGLIGIISQLGYVLAYGLVGPLADFVFIPMLTPNGILSSSVGKLIGTGTVRGIGLLIILAGFLLSVTAILLYRIPSIRRLEKRGEVCTEN